MRPTHSADVALSLIHIWSAGGGGVPGAPAGVRLDSRAPKPCLNRFRAHIMVAECCGGRLAHVDMGRVRRDARAEFRGKMRIVQNIGRFADRNRGDCSAFQRAGMALDVAYRRRAHLAGRFAFAREMTGGPGEMPGPQSIDKVSEERGLNQK